MAEVKIWPRGQNETGGILLMPMKKNIPKGHPEWSLVKCPICGQECWRPMSRQELRQKKMQAACTECGLKIESRRNQKPTMKLTEMLGQYEELLDKKDQLAKDTKDNNAAIDKLKAEIAEMMIDEDIPSQGYGDYIYSLQDKVKYSKRGEAYLQERGLSFFEVLREQGLGELIKETVNAGSLQSAMKEIAEENDGELPPELDEVVSSYEMTDIARRKSTNKALKRAKGE